ncbi:MAG: hypothetical protein JXQ72_10330 [Anaerolineae bacterium]|nr:hypothetical protein [Anaerolineae bacterium]
MQLSGVHILLSYKCTIECDHCFVWGSPWQSGTMTLDQLRELLRQSEALGTVEWVYFEGGEPFLYYPLLIKGVHEAAAMGFKVGVVSNSYWATSVEDAVMWLEPLAGKVQDLSISNDIYHWNTRTSQQAEFARAAAEKLGIPLGEISIAQPEDVDTAGVVGQLPLGESTVIYRGRAAEKLAGRADHHPWDGFTDCPYENLREPGRIHVDPFGEVQICHGISLGNVFETPLSDICATYDPDAHLITGPILAGGPVELVRRYDVAHREQYADACHLCDDVRRTLRPRFPVILKPDQMYGVAEG